jgi:hypothetical protein
MDGKEGKCGELKCNQENPTDIRLSCLPIWFLYNNRKTTQHQLLSIKLLE